MSANLKGNRKARIKCRFCSWSTLKWRTNKKGKRISGYKLLEEYVIMEHFDKLKQISPDVDNEYFERMMR